MPALESHDASIATHEQSRELSLIDSSRLQQRGRASSKVSILMLARSSNRFWGASKSRIFRSGEPPPAFTNTSVNQLLRIHATLGHRQDKVLGFCQLKDIPKIAGAVYPLQNKKRSSSASHRNRQPFRRGLRAVINEMLSVLSNVSPLLRTGVQPQLAPYLVAAAAVQC